MSILLGLTLLAHGTAHLVGFFGPFGLLPGGAMYRPALFDGRIAVSTTTAKLLGSAWLATAIAFAIASVAVWLRVSWWLPYTGAVAGVSLVLSALCYPDSKLGIPLNLSLLVFLVAAHHAGALQ